MFNFKTLSIGYLFVIISLFFYSFTQVDLSLTLSEASWWQTVQKFFQQIGYFNRPLSAVLYSVIVISMFTFYILFLKLARVNLINKKQLWILILITTAILTFSYNAFSYDLFNYIFDAKIVTFYQQNPYIHKALDYLGDPMLSFMHWTHRYYPYGPIWLALTIPLSYIGFNVFLPTFFMFKILTSVCFLGTAYFIGKILKIVSPKKEVLGIAFFALNPLVLIESLVSSHNDISMMFLAIFAVYLALMNKYIFSLISILLSVGIKFATGILIPVFLLFFIQKKNISKEGFLNILFFAMFIPLILVVIRTNFQPWYLMLILPFASLIPSKSYAMGAGLILSFFALAQYLPYIYIGDWNEPIPQILLWLTIGGFLIYLFYCSIARLLNWDRK
ncbi:MAG: hypothetical protein AAB675_02115 [Patescibacteria group bacterium]